jgi:hypothetical protein
MMKNLRKRLFILSVSAASAVGALLLLVKPILGGIKGWHDGDL